MRHLTPILLLLLLSTPILGQQRPQPTPCTEDPKYGQLDFWLGEWEVFADDQRLGRNRIEKILSGCALMEHWTDEMGGEGKSLFYLAQADGESGRVWRQVWVTDYATAPGGTKEKTLVRELEGGGLRFQGEITLPEGRTYLDRTTLEPDGDKVRQLIEISTDGGETWRAVFDALYHPATKEAAEPGDGAAPSEEAPSQEVAPREEEPESTSEGSGRGSTPNRRGASPGRG